MFMKFLKINSPVRSDKQNHFILLKGKYLRAQRGFTLIEVIAVLLIVGILAALGGMGIVQAVKGYIVVRQNTAITQKAQSAMSRITREVIEMVNVPSTATTSLLPITNCSSNVCEVRNIGLDNGAVKIAFGSNTLANGDTLIDNVQDLTLKYCSGSITGASACNITSWPSGDDIHLAAVDVSLTIANPNGGNLTFLNRISPRNNGNLGGANIPTTNTGTPSSWNIPNCFVATAAYGDAGHPMVQILRDFRDNYLISFPGGKWFINQYYAHGPAAADLIRNRPVAMWAVRCLLAPVVAFIFCLMYAPAAIPFLLFASLIITMTVFSAFRRKAKVNVNILQSRGSILIGLIITMVIMAVLAAAMLPLFSSSYMNQVYADKGRKAYFLAESGYRHAASQFLWAGTESARYNVILELNGGTSGTTNTGKTCTLMNDTGSFTTVMYPWYSRTSSYSGNELQTSYIGTADPEIVKNTSGGYIAVGAESPAYYSYTSRSVSGDTVTFAGIAASSPTTSVSLAAANLMVRPAAKTTSGSFSKGGNLQLTSGFDELPFLNGNFTLVKASGGKIRTSVSGGEVFNYKSRVGNTIYNITLADADRNAIWNSAEVINVPASTNVVLEEFIRIASTGRTLDGTTRTVTYNTAIGWIHGGGFQKEEEQIGNGPGELLSASGMYNTTGDTINITGVQDKDTITDIFPGLIGMIAQFVVDVIDEIFDWFWGTCDQPNPKINFIGANLTQTSTNPAEAWVDAQGFLSYDIQVKVEAAGQSSFFAGPTFRGRNIVSGGNNVFATYGVSFAKARRYWHSSAQGCIACYTIDQIGSFFPGLEGDPSWQWCGLEDTGSDQCSLDPASPSYDYSLPTIVLWRIGTNTRVTMLAYRTLTTDDGIVSYDSSTNAWRLNPDYSTLLVRVAEGYAITFSSGVSEIKEGDIITNSAGSRSARVVMTPILTGGSWAGGNAAGTLVVANVSNGTSGAGFSSGAINKNGTQVAAASGFDQNKRNYIRVYFSHPGPADRGTVADPAYETDTIRHANQVNSHKWPPDSLSELDASKDYFTLVQWTGTAADTVANTDIGPNLASTSGWTLGSDWNRSCYLGSNCGIHHSYGGADWNDDFSTAAYTLNNTVAGTRYAVEIDVFRTNGSIASAYYDIGCSIGNRLRNDASPLWSTKTYKSSFVATGTTTPIVVTVAESWGGTITRFSVKPYNHGAMSSTSEPKAIIRDNDLTSPTPSCMTSDPTNFTCTVADFLHGSYYGDTIGLFTMGDTATNISYDDWWIQLDLKKGTGLTPPIQQ